MTLLKRIGNKDRIASDIIRYFPEHRTYIEMFFGAGGIFFNKPKAKYNILNDLDGDVFNLYEVVRDRKDELIEQFSLMPVDQNLFNKWKLTTETDPILKAVRFLFLSNFGYMGKPQTFHLKLSKSNLKRYAMGRIEPINKLLEGVLITNKDFRTLLSSISFDHKDKEDNRSKTFIYADPPYLSTTHNYNIDKWKEQDTIDLFEILVNSGIRFVISDFNNSVILDLAKSHNLEVIEIGERRTLKNRQTEILIVNYEIKTGQTNLF